MDGQQPLLAGRKQKRTSSVLLLPQPTTQHNRRAAQSMLSFPSQRAASTMLLVREQALAGRAWGRRCSRAAPPRLLRARAGESEAMPPASMSVDEALGILGISKNEQSFEQILNAKNKQLAASQSNQQRQMEIEAAYDVLFMQSMKKRITGELEVSSSVRYADVPSKKRSSQRSSSPQPALLQKLPGGVSVEAPKQGVAAGQAAVFGGLATWALVQAVLESPDAQAADTAGLQLAAALAFAVYGFREYKKLPLARSVGLSFGSLVAGIMLGAALNAWLRVDIVPIGSFGSPGVMVSTFGILSLAAASAFLA